MVQWPWKIDFWILLKYKYDDGKYFCHKKYKEFLLKSFNDREIQFSKPLKYKYDDDK